MKTYKLSALFLLIVLALTGCTDNNQKNTNTNKYLFSAEQSDIFPFYCIGQDDKLWRVERHGATSTDIVVNYPSGSRSLNFVKYLKEEDTVIFATDIIVKNGQNLATIGQLTGQGQDIIAEKIKLDTLRLKDNGDMLFIDENDTLFFRRNGIVIEIEEGVAQSEFVDGDNFLFRLKKGQQTDGEYLYPIYSATAEYRNHLMDAQDIVASDSENGKAYIIKGRRTVQKRTSAVEVANLFVYADGEILFEIPSVVLSQFQESKHIFLISCNEKESTLKYDLYRIDSSQAVLKAKDILWGRYISLNRDVYAYEIFENGTVKTKIIDYADNVSTYSLSQSCSLENIFFSGQDVYVFEDGALRVLENGAVSLTLQTGINAVKNTENGLILFKGKTPPYSVSVCKNKTIKNTAGNVQSNKVLYKDENLYYYTGEGNDLSLVDATGVVTAFTSNIDTNIGFIVKQGTVAVAKFDDKTLHIVSQSGIINAGLKIKKFVTEV